MTDNGRSRRRFLRAAGLGGTIATAGCLRLIGGGGGTPTPTPTATSDIRDTDGDGVIDSEDYAPRDPDVQRKEQVNPTESPMDTTGDINYGFEDSDLSEWSGETRLLSVVSDPVAAGEYAGSLHNPDGGNHEVTYSQGRELRPIRIEWYFRATVVTDSMIYHQPEDAQGNRLSIISVGDDGPGGNTDDVGVYTGDGWRTFYGGDDNTAQQWYRFAFENIDYNQGVFDAVAETIDGTEIERFANLPFGDEGFSGFYGFTWNNNTGQESTAYLDSLSVMV